MWLKSLFITPKSSVQDVTTTLIYFYSMNYQKVVSVRSQITRSRPAGRFAESGNRRWAHVPQKVRYGCAEGRGGR